MKLKLENECYNTAKIPRYNKLIAKLEILLKDNRNKRKYHGIRHNGRIGILVDGMGSDGITKIKRFFSINDINYYFHNHIERLKKHGERRLVEWESTKS